MTIDPKHIDYTNPLDLDEEAFLSRLTSTIASKHSDVSQHVLRNFREGFQTILDWLIPPQKAWILDFSPFSTILKRRQLGISEGSVAQAVLLASLYGGLDIYFTKQRAKDASRVFLSRARERWIPAFQQLPILGPQLEIVNDTKNQITFTNGASIIATSNDPKNMAGNVGAYYLDEIEKWNQRLADQVREELFPTISNPINQQKGCKLRIVSTPYVEGSLYYNIWHGDKDDKWTRHKWDVHDCQDFMPEDIDELKEENKSTPEAFQRNYLCEWVSSSYYYFNHRVIEQCHTPSNPRINEDTSKLVAGIDVGKKQDFTAVTFLHKDNSHYHVDKTYLIRRVSYEKIAQIAAELLSNYQPASALVDETANTAFLDSLKTKTAQHIDDLNEGYDEPPKQVTLREWWEPESDYDMPYIEGDRATNEKNQMRVDKLTECMDKAQFSYTDDVMVWNDDTEAFEPFPKSLVQYDLKHVKQETTRAGRPTYDVERTEEMGHGDVFSSILLALQACDTGQPDEIMMGVLH